jgi:uncharacterized protein
VLAIVDAGPLFAVMDRRDADRQRCREVFQRRDLDFVIPALVVAEVSYMVARSGGPRSEASFLRGLELYEVEAPAPHDWGRIADLVEQYGDFPLGGADASIIVLAERLDTDLVITLDQRHFRAVRPRHCPAFRILPE